MNENLNTNVETKHGKKRLLILLLLLVITGIMLSTSTYAWFTANQTVSVSNIRVNVAAQNGIQISADGTTWKSILQTTDIIGAHSVKYPTSVNQIPAVLEPVSTTGTITGGKLEMWYGDVKTNVGGDYILTSTQSVETESNGAESTGKFIAFDMFLKVTADSPVYLTSSSGITTDDVTDSGIKNAARVNFITLGNTASGSDLNTIQGLGATGTPTALLWEPNWDSHTAAGKANAKDVYGLTVDTVAANNTVPLAYDGIKAAITEDKDILLGNANKTYNTGAYAAYFDTVTPSLTTRAAWTGTDPATYLDLLTLTSGITKIRIYVWVEGQDVDCENTASGGNITFNLQITTNNGE